METNKYWYLAIIIFIIIASILLVGPACSAKFMANPDIPQFTLQLNKTSYNITDPYTGAIQQVDNSTIDIAIKNQYFNTTYDIMNNITTSLYYHVQIKGHYTENWTEAYDSVNFSYPLSDKVYTWYNYPVQSNSDVTTISIPANYSVGSKIDIRIQAVIANQTHVNIPNFILNPFRGGEYITETIMIVIQSSNWSPIQTINIGSTTNFMGLDWIETAALSLFVAVVFLMVIVIGWRRYTKNKQNTYQ